MSEKENIKLQAPLSSVQSHGNRNKVGNGGKQRLHSQGYDTRLQMVWRGHRERQHAQGSSPSLTVAEALEEREKMAMSHNCSAFTPTHVCIRYGGHPPGEREHVWVRITDL